MLARIGLYFSYWLRAKGPNRVHSPFVFSLYTDVILPDKQYYAFEAIEKIRTKLLENNSLISDSDPGAGSKSNPHQKTVRSIAHSSLLSPKQGRLLFRLTNHLQPKTILELGTSLGISALYLAKPTSAQVHTIEGRPSLVKLAQQNAKLLHAPNITIHSGRFEDVLPSLLPQLKQVDMLYLDGNHTFEATLRYFEQIRPYMHSDTVIIMDDIRWSIDMMKAWLVLSKQSDIHVSIDLQKLGLLFFRPSQVKEHFILRV